MNTNKINKTTKINVREEFGKKIHGQGFKLAVKQVKECTTPIPNLSKSIPKLVKQIPKPESKKTEPNDSFEECGSDYFNWYSAYSYLYYNHVDKSVSPSKYIKDMFKCMSVINQLIKKIICGLGKLNSTLEKGSKISAKYDASFVLNTIDREHTHFILLPESLNYLRKTVTDQELLDNIVNYGIYLHSILTAVRYSTVDSIITEHHLAFWKYEPEKVKSLISDLEKYGFVYKTN